MTIETIQSSQATEDGLAIRQLVADWLTASQAGDTERVLNLMADDVVILVAGQPPMRGKSAFAEAQKVLLGKAPSLCKMRTKKRS